MRESFEINKVCEFHECASKKQKEYFTQITCTEQIEVPEQKLDIEEVVSAIIDTEIVSLKVISTAKGVSYEGQRLTGKKLAIEIKLKQKIKYIADEETQSMHVVENEFLQSTYIILPNKIKGTDPKVLLENGYLKVKIKVEEVVLKKMDMRTISKSVHLLITAYIIPTYEICYTEDENCTNSHLFITYDDCTMKKQLTFFKKCKIYLPQWSPTGQCIAFIAKNKFSDVYSLYVTSPKSFTLIPLTPPNISVSSFYWGRDNSTLFFTGNKNCSKEIYKFEMASMNYKQLTYSKPNVKNYKPKSSPDGEKIAYIKNINQDINLYLTDSNGLGTRRLTNCGGLMDFTWAHDSNLIAYVENSLCDKKYHCSDEDNFESTDIINIIDIHTLYKQTLSLENIELRMKKILFSPTNRFLSFIGKNKNGENIYIYDLLKNRIVNLTCFEVNVQISDYTWKVDSNTIYFAANDLGSFNIYLIEINNREKVQLTSTNADKILLDYRPKIV